MNDHEVGDGGGQLKPITKSYTEPEENENYRGRNVSDEEAASVDTR